MIEKRINLQLFGTEYDINRTLDPISGHTANDLSPEMKTYYSDYLIDNATPNLVHDQFAQKHPIPKNGGKSIEFRKYDPFPKATTPITEGVTPAGHKMNVTTITAYVNQFGDFVEMSDVLLLTAIDNNMVQATKLLGNQAGETLDWVTREVLNQGTNVLYAKGTGTRPTERSEVDSTNVITVDDIQNAVRILKKANAKKIGDSFVGIVGPDIAYTLQRDPEFIAWHQYARPEELYAGELGKIGGVRFVETTEAKIFEATPLTDAAPTLTVKTAVTSDDEVTVVEAISADEATRIEELKNIFIGSTEVEVASVAAGTAGNAVITLSAAGTFAANAVVAAADAGVGGMDVHSTLILAENAYGVTEIAGGGLQHIVKQLGSSGSADPLNQRATVGWKAIKTAEILVEGFMVRIESASK